MLNNVSDLLLVAKSQESEEPIHEVLEYISLDGTQYFDTGYYGNLDTKIEARINVTFDSQAALAFMGDMTTSSSAITIPLNSSVGTGLYSRFGNTYITTGLSITTGTHEIVVDKSGFYLDGVKKGTFNATTPFTTVGTLLIGAYSGLARNYFAGDIDIIKISENNTLVHNYVPALDYLLRPCLYDRISKTFLYAKKLSDGTTTYDLGFKRWNKYEVDCIEGTGTQYINMGFVPSSNTRVLFDYEPTKGYTGISSIFGCQTSSAGNGCNRFYYLLSGQALYKAQFNYTNSGTSSNSTPNYWGINYDSSINQYSLTTGVNGDFASNSGRQTVDIDGYNKTIQINNGNIIDMSNDSTFTKGMTSTYSMFLFDRSLAGTSSTNKFKGKIYYFKIWDSGILVRDFKPSVRTYNDGTSVVTKAFLYDEAYNKAYDNAGTGSFKAYIEGITVPYTLDKHSTMDTDGFYLAEDGTKTVSSDGTSCYTSAIPVKEGDIVEWSVTAEAVSANKRIHGYSTNADITTNQKGSWVEMLAKIVFSTTSETTQKTSFVVPSGVNYIRLSHANTRETQDNIRILNTTLEVGKSVSGTPSGSVLGVSNCFDTSLYGTQNTTVKYFAIGYDSNTTAGQLFGSYDGNTETSKNLTINSTGTGSTAPIRFDGQLITTPIKIPINTFASIITSRYGLWVNDTLHGNWGNVNDFTTSTTMLILKCNNSTNTRNNGCGYCLILEKDVPVAEYIPVRNASNTSIYGLYDRVSKELNTGVGTINFNALD